MVEIYPQNVLSVSENVGPDSDIPFFCHHDKADSFTPWIIFMFS